MEICRTPETQRSEFFLADETKVVRETNCVWITYHPLDKIIEAVVTNNVGYHVRDELRNTWENYTGTFQYADGRIVEGGEVAGLHWHLKELEYSRVFPGWGDTVNLKIPVMDRMPIDITSWS